MVNQNNSNNNRTEFETPRASSEVIMFTTTLRAGDYVDQVARFEHQEMRRVTRFQTNVDIPTVDEIRNYLVTLLDLRVKIANRSNLGTIGKNLNQLRVPARWFVLLAQVGEAYDTTRRFKFCPVLNLPVVETTKGRGQAKECTPDADTPVILSSIEMIEISQRMEFLMEEGYVTVPGVPRDPEGSLQFMAKTNIGNIIRGMDKDNPAYAFLAFILESEVAAESYDNLDLVFRINYSSFDTYSAAFRQYFTQTTDELGGNSNARESAQ